MNDSGQTPEQEPDASEPGPPGPPIDYTQPPKTESGSRADPWAHRRAEPRAFAAFWLIYLVAIFGVSAGGAGGLGLVAYDVYRTVARTAMVLVAIGIGVLWPLIRLSQRTPERINRSAVQDYIVIVLPLAMVCLPQSFGWLADWPLAVTLRLWACLAAWALAVAMLVATAQHRQWAPWVAMATCLLICFGGAVFSLGGSQGPVAAGAADIVAFSDLLSMPTAVMELTRDRSWTGLNASVTDGHWMVLVAPLGAAMFCALFGIFVPGERRA